MVASSGSQAVSLRSTSLRNLGEQSNSSYCSVVLCFLLGDLCGSVVLGCPFLWRRATSHEALVSIAMCFPCSSESAHSDRFRYFCFVIILWLCVSLSRVCVCVCVCVCVYVLRLCEYLCVCVCVCVCFCVFAYVRRLFLFVELSIGLSGFSLMCSATTARAFCSKSYVRGSV